MNMRVLHHLTGSGFLVLDGKALYRCNQGGAVRGASAAEVPQGQKPIARKQPNAGLKACSTLWQFHLSLRRLRCSVLSFKLTHRRPTPHIDLTESNR